MVIKDPDGTAIQLSKGHGGPVKQGCPNYCKSGIMSCCGAGSVWHNQKKCRFYQKSTVSNRCMHYIEALNGHCDSMQAQRESTSIPCKARANLNLSAFGVEDYLT
jgi:hypothetical protein